MIVHRTWDTPDGSQITSDHGEFNDAYRAKAELRLAVDQAAWRSMEHFEGIIDTPNREFGMEFTWREENWEVTVTARRVN